MANHHNTNKRKRKRKEKKWKISNRYIWKSLMKTNWTASRSLPFPTPMLFEHPAISTSPERDAIFREFCNRIARKAQQ
jgi:hypothetical protein